jgi:hypothetical protein
LRITVTIDAPTGDFQEQLLALLAHYVADIEIDTTWSPQRAALYVQALSPGARSILNQAVARGGFVEAEYLRGTDGTASLRGRSGAFSAALDRGIVKGWWPEGTPLPVQAAGTGYGKITGYYIIEEAKAAFFTDGAVRRLNALGTGGETSQRRALAEAIRVSTGDWDTDRAIAALHQAGHGTVDGKGARAVLRHLADNGLIVKADPERAVYRLNTEQ